MLSNKNSLSKGFVTCCEHTHNLYIQFIEKMADKSFWKNYSTAMLHMIYNVLNRNINIMAIFLQSLFELRNIFTAYCSSNYCAIFILFLNIYIWSRNILVSRIRLHSKRGLCWHITKNKTWNYSFCCWFFFCFVIWTTCAMSTPRIAPRSSYDATTILNSIWVL